MKGRILTTFVVLAMTAAACAGPDLVGNDDVNQENESVINDAASADTARGDEASGPEPEPDPGAQTTPTTGDESPLVTNPPKETPSTATTSPPATGGGTVDPSLAPFVDQAKADLAARLGVDAGAIALISAELVEWSDASLGCPQPGMVYAQVPTDGSLITLLHGGAEYRYHTGGSVYFPFLCE